MLIAFQLAAFALIATDLSCLPLTIVLISFGLFNTGGLW